MHANAICDIVKSTGKSGLWAAQSCQIIECTSIALPTGNVSNPVTYPKGRAQRSQIFAATGKTFKATTPIQ